VAKFKKMRRKENKPRGGSRRREFKVKTEAHTKTAKSLLSEPSNEGSKQKTKKHQPFYFFPC
jgi:hypothetical protein